MTVLKGLSPLALLLGAVAGLCPVSALANQAEMVAIPTGPFVMGCSAKEEAKGMCVEAAKPAHTVELDAYHIDKFEVTFRRYNRCVAEGSCTELFIGGGCNAGMSWNASHPVNCVDYRQAETFCRWEGKRLPTEAEWEKAARGTDDRIFPWGNESASCKLTVMNQKTDKNTMGPGCGAGTTQPVGSRPDGASPYGVVDMAGNLYEWTSDWFSESYFSRSPARNPKGPASGEHKVLRGGSWLMRTDYGLAINTRSGYSPLGQGYVVGFRCAADRDPQVDVQ